MQYLLAKEKDLNSIYELVQGTIKEIYKKYYTEEVVDFFVCIIGLKILNLTF